MCKNLVGLFIVFASLGAVFCSMPFFISNISETNKENYHNEVNTSIEPCTNFYEYSCSSWISKAEKPNFDPFLSHFTAVSYEINQNIEEILENSTDQYLDKALTFYRACKEANSKDETYFTDLKLLIEYFKGWPMANRKWSNENFFWLEEVVQVTKILGIHPILKLYVAIDYKATEKYSLYIEPGTFIYPQNILIHPEKYSTEIAAYHQWILKTVQHLYPQKSVPKSLKLQVKKMIDFEIDLAKLVPRVSRIEKISIERLTKKTFIDFEKYLGNLLSDTEVKINVNDTVVVRNYGYFRSVVQYLKKVDPKIIANYIIWSVVKGLSRDSTKYLQDLNFSIDKTIFKITSDTPRKMECVSKTMDHFSYLLLPKYLEKYFDKQYLPSIEDMAANIKIDFEKILEKNQWLSEETKKLAIHKVRNIQFHVGYSKPYEDKNVAYERYQNLKITDDHLQNVLTIKNFKVENNLKLLEGTVKSAVWPCNIFDVNAYYSILQNSVFIPLGLLTVPFYDKNRPAVENYGSIGSLIGHEISHSLDSTGRQANIQGIISKWWPTQDILDYQIRTKCFQDLYGSQNVFNLGENIADIVGLEISYNALVNDNLESLLENREKLDRMFFVSYAQIWCEKSYQSDIFNDEHTAVQNRVNNAVYNNPHFRSAFKCTDILTNEICELWQ